MHLFVQSSKLAPQSERSLEEKKKKKKGRNRRGEMVDTLSESVLVFENSPPYSSFRRSRGKGMGQKASNCKLLQSLSVVPRDNPPREK